MDSCTIVRIMCLRIQLWTFRSMMSCDWTEIREPTRLWAKIWLCSVLISIKNPLSTLGTNSKWRCLRFLRPEGTASNFRPWRQKKVHFWRNKQVFKRHLIVRLLVNPRCRSHQPVRRVQMYYQASMRRKTNRNSLMSCWSLRRNFRSLARN